MKNSNKLLLIILLVFLPTLSGITLSNTKRLPSGLYSDVRYIEETGDVLGVEVFFTISMEGNSTESYALVQTFEGVPLPPTLVKVEMDGETIKLALPESMGRMLTGKIEKDEFIATFAISEEKVVLKRRTVTRCVYSGDFVTFILLFLVATASNNSSGCLVESARNQIGVTVTYDSTYVRLRYPGGDIPPDRGVCTDVLIRAYRACGADLQVLVHEDMKTAWAKYPKLWDQTGPDSNIDHRRVPNLAVFFARHGQTLSTSHNASAYEPGDIVTWKLPSGVPHIGFVSDHKNDNGIPLVIHNIGAGAREEDELFLYTITGHYRFVPQRQ